MTTQQILNENWTKTKKGKALFDLGHTRREVADLVCNGNYGFAYNIWKKWSDEGGTPNVAQTLEFLTEFAFNRKFGIEMEFFGSEKRKLIAHMNMSRLGYNFESYNHQTRGHWKFVTDSSIRGGNGRELVSPPLKGISGLKDLRKACKALRLSKAKINKSCGLHVHIDANDFQLSDFKVLAKNWVSIEKEIDKIMPESRRENNNTFCKSNKIANANRKIDRAESVESLATVFGNRYVKLNFNSYQRHGTVEFRHHGGTVNYRKIKAWVFICTRIVEASKQGILINKIKQILDEDLQEYFEERQLDFI